MLADTQCWQWQSDYTRSCYVVDHSFAVTDIAKKQTYMYALWQATVIISESNCKTWLCSHTLLAESPEECSVEDETTAIVLQLSDEIFGDSFELFVWKSR